MAWYDSLTMTDIQAIVTAVTQVIANENATRYRGKPQLDVEAPKLQPYEFQGLPRIDWHSGIRNNLCAFSYSFDDSHCAAYVYVFEESDALKCTLRVSNIDGSHLAELPSISRSLDDHKIARLVVDTLVAGTECMQARGAVEQCVGAKRRLLTSQLKWCSDGSL
jgi:hypothetical protein